MFDLDKKYDRSEFLHFLQSDFLPEDFQPKTHDVTLDFKSQYAKEIVCLGKCESMGLEVFEIKHDSLNDPRVGMSKDAFKLLLHTSFCNKALIVFVPRNDVKYRFSLIQIEAHQEDKSSRIKRSYSNPRRYSYVLGEGAHTRTPKEFLLKKGRLCNADPFNDLLERFSVEVLTKEFYNELSNWYFWALKNVRFPDDVIKNEEERNSSMTIRLITRLLFVWFIKQKKLVPDQIFNEGNLDKWLKKIDSTGSTYYKAILQNLFFATLNVPIQERGKFVERQHGVNSFFRYERYFTKEGKETFPELMKSIPFLNGGLFDNLDKNTEDTNKNNHLRLDCFSNRLDNESRLSVPDYLFFSDNQTVDLHEEYNNDPSKRNTKVRGIIRILNDYNFTIEENTPLDVEVALDPELLGRVFENLLASFNPETKETARKETGSFYTPREIVNYMVNESLVAYLKQETGASEDNLRKILDYNNDDITLENDIRSKIITSVFNCKILDPACGSGAFPMGMLQQMVHILRRIDEDNMFWKKLVLDDALKASKEAFTQEGESREKLLSEIGKSFDSAVNRPDYSRKLFLIKNCIFGVDIQPIAVQISKLRFFISLVCEQNKTDDINNNFGIMSLPNLETKFVAADSLIALKQLNTQGDLLKIALTPLETELKQARDRYFSARSPETKKKYKEMDKQLRKKISEVLVSWDLPEMVAKRLSAWDPYDQNSVANFFSPEWMFGIKEGFDIIIGNPPYVQLQKDHGKLAERYKPYDYKTFASSGDVYCLFYECGCNLLKDNGYLCFITSNKWMRAAYAKNTRKFLAEKTNPVLIIDFAGTKIFESATVDTNVLLFSKKQNEGHTKSCITKTKDIGKLTDYVSYNSISCRFVNSDIWSILTPLEKGIKEKIERVGKPLKKWDIQIYRGILTGFNEAFVISGAQKDELIASDHKSTDIIRPILRGRDIKKYNYVFADKWLINTHNGVREKGVKAIDVNDYPAIKIHLDKYWEQLQTRSDQGDTPYNLRNCAYLEDFYKEKIVYPDIMRLPRENSSLNDYPYFYFDTTNFYLEATNFMIVGNNIENIFLFLCSDIGFFTFTKFYSGPQFDQTGFRFKKEYINELFVPVIDKETTVKFKNIIHDLHSSKTEKIITQNEVENIYSSTIGLNEEENEYIKSYKNNLLL
ncbi:MAG: Eco57I restriction-modification methylase domain-containing protein [Synergistaceae bacterium]|nr:Eco57I restriction-modification methylase domain-containing protein [Synergistaceae bacterium]